MDLTGYFKQAESEPVRRVLAERGLPHLYRVFEERFEVASGESSDFVWLLQTFASYQTPESIERLIRAARRPEIVGRYSWPGILRAFGAPHQLGRERVKDKRAFSALYDALLDPLPTGNIELPYLDWVNVLAREDGLLPHPFDTNAGVRRLREMIVAKPDDREGVDPVSAVAALPYIKHASRDELLALATNHSADEVRIEAGWAAAMLKKREGVALLVKYCADPRYTGLAQRYLREAELDDQIPEKIVEAPDFEALSQMSWQLRNPDEFGRVPDSISLLDTREIYWPPSQKKQRLWLVKYTYAPRGEQTKQVTGVGLVGVLYPKRMERDDADQLSVMDWYALHCCAEAQYERLANAPKEISVDAGRRLLDRK